MTFEEVVRSRRTHKVYGDEPVAPEVLLELLDLARWAPNHNLTNPWRFRVLGPGARARLKAAADALDEGSGRKLDRAPTLVAVSSLRIAGDPIAEEEDLLAVGCAAYVVLLAAHERGLASYWRTPAVLRTRDGRAAVGMGDDEHPVGLLYLGPKRQEQPPPERAPLLDVVSFLD